MTPLRSINPAESGEIATAPQVQSPLGELPDKPLVTIQRGTGWRAVDLKELWQFRELLYFLTWRDVKVRYKQTAIGVVWIVLQPLLMTLTFSVLFGRLARVPSDGVPYPLLAFSGLLPWTFFSSALLTASNSLVGHAYMITKVYFPRMIIPGAAVAGRVIDLLVSFAAFTVLMIYYGVQFTPRMFLIPVLVLLTALFALGVGMWTSAMNVKYRDIGVALPIVTMLWMFASPVVYPSSLVYDHVRRPLWRFVYTLNPLVGIIDNFRAALFGMPFNWPALISTVVITMVLLMYSAYEFKRMERGFADIV